MVDDRYLGRFLGPLNAVVELPEPRSRFERRCDDAVGLLWPAVDHVVFKGADTFDFNCDGIPIF